MVKVMQKTLDLIVNPIAGGKHGKKIQNCVSLAESRLKERSAPYTVHFSTKKGGVKELTEQIIKNGATDVVVFGGDGTLHETINGFSNFDRVNLGIVPCGTGNDFATAINLPLDPIRAIDLIIDGTPKYTDFMQMPSVRGLNVIGMGMDVEVLNRYEKLKKKNKFGYTKCLIKTLFNFDCINFRADTDGENEDYNSFIACVANGSMFGGGIKICPTAVADDGKLNFVAVESMEKLGIINAFLQLKRGKILEHKKTHHKLAESIKVINSAPHYTVNVDGELYDDIPFEIKIVSNTLKIYRN